MSLEIEDYGKIARLLREAFGQSVVFGMEGGYNVPDLALAVRETIGAFI
jgi:acetoin utilization deacetylase AcuC-like enzyme